MSAPTIARSAFLVMLAIACVPRALGADIASAAQPRSYLDVATSGKLSIVPYVWEGAAHGKQLAVIGTRHVRDPRSPMFARIDAVIRQVRPQLILHESEASSALATLPRDQAIEAAADFGFAVYSAHRYGVPASSADAPPKEEIRRLLAYYPAEDVCVFLTAQRLIGSVRRPDLRLAAAGYPDFLRSYLLPNGLPDRPGCATWAGFVHEYERVVGHPLTSRRWNPDLINPIHRTGRLSEIARTSDGFRDSYLLATIRNALRDNDRVVVVFGQWHVLALEPMLGGLLGE